MFETDVVAVIRVSSQAVLRFQGHSVPKRTSQLWFSSEPKFQTADQSVLRWFIAPPNLLFLSVGFLMLEKR